MRDFAAVQKARDAGATFENILDQLDECMPEGEAGVQLRAARERLRTMIEHLPSEAQLAAELTREVDELLAKAKPQLPAEPPKAAPKPFKPTGVC